ncbi:MAG: polyprenyl synthetase family protein [Verrucomicrobia bacterium]|nr:polyprenyl synthetase family protein [Verrucomicrobiota bacterium]
MNASEEVDSAMEEHLWRVRQVMTSCLAETPLRSVLSEHQRLLGSGKMLRARTAFRLQPATTVSPETVLRSSAAVEMIHAASLLHDDVIDGGVLRRGAPAFWVERGVSGAILLGDLLLFKALDLCCQSDNGHLTSMLVKLTGEVCQAETEQELLFRGEPAEWDRCIRIARRKTGSLFAFIAYACGGDDEELSEALKEAGYQAGTAYQLSDDILDIDGERQGSDKTLGTDEAREKTTAARAVRDTDANPIQTIEGFYESSISKLEAWPEVQKAWVSYLELDLKPAVERNVSHYGA